MRLAIVRLVKRVACALVLGAATCLAIAEQKVDFDKYELHYIVLNTTVLNAEVAKQHGIARSRKRAFINLAVLTQSEDGYGEPVAVELTASQRSLIGQRSQIQLAEIREGRAIYYIGSFEILNREMLWFDIALKVPLGPDFEFTFAQQVWQE